MVFIVADCATMAIRGADDGGNNSNILSPSGSVDAFLVLELIFSAVFTMELILRVLAAEELKLYIRDFWNIFDCILVIQGWVTLFLSSSGRSNLGLSWPKCGERTSDGNRKSSKSAKALRVAIAHISHIHAYIYFLKK